MSNITGIPRVDDYLRRLGELSPDGWLRMGRLESDLDASADLGVCALIADVVIRNERLELARWYALDAVDTCAELAEWQLGRASRSARADMARARNAAHRAALALLAWEQLPLRDSDMLCATVNSVLAARRAAS